MVSVAEASTIVLGHVRRFRTKHIALEQAAGTVLAEAVMADRDLPPVNRVTMDGIALVHAAWTSGRRTFDVAGTQAAGSPPMSIGQDSQCVEVMTGAVLPKGTDTVVPYEEIRMEGKTATVSSVHVRYGQNLHFKGSDALAGAPLLKSGTLISPAEIALLATVGKDKVSVYDFPATAVVSSGDELVAVHERPEPHQVRRSNTYAILSAMDLMGWKATAFHLPDNKDTITGQLNEILNTYDTVILSGGVSKGKFDFIPEALEDNGIEKRFHRVNQRPGKPFWFGTSPDGQKTVFALPGNPVSTYLCFYRYVRPWAFACREASEELRYAVLGEDFKAPTGLTYFLQVKALNERGVITAYPDAGGGSGDLANLSGVTGFLQIEASGGNLEKGQVFPYYPFRY